MGAGLAVVPLVGLLESIAMAKSFGEMPTAYNSPNTHTHTHTRAHSGLVLPGVFAYSNF